MNGKNIEVRKQISLLTENKSERKSLETDKSNFKSVSKVLTMKFTESIIKTK